MNNPLLHPFTTPHETAPFSKIHTNHFLTAIEFSIEKAKNEWQELINNPEKPTFENTLKRLDQLGELLSRNASLLHNLNAAETSPELQKTTQQAAPLLTDFYNNLRLDPALFERIQYVYSHKDNEQLTTEEQTLLNKQYKSFTRNGALLASEDKKRLKQIDTELTQLSLRFGEHVLADTQNYFLHLTKTSDIKGLPDSAVSAAKAAAQDRNLDGWVITLDYPSYLPFMTYAENRERRKELALAFGRKGFQKNSNNNETILLKLAQLRHQRAQLLGYESHAAFVLEERMAQSETEVRRFLDHLHEQARPAAENEWEALITFARKQLGIDSVQKWDTAFITEKIKQEKLQLNEQELKPYFALPNVLQGLFAITQELYGLHFKKTDSIEGYHPDVQCFEVTDTKGNFVAVLYMDFFPRPGKRNGAWMTTFRSQKKGIRPHVSIVCNFTPPSKTVPSLLTFQEVTTLFHEFGHALHGMLSNTTYSSLSGTSVYWDFVELPSQIMENWCYEEEALKRFAKHYQTGDVLELEQIKKLKKIAQFQQGLQTLRQLSFAYLDLSYHGKDAATITRVKEHEKNVLRPFQWTPDVEENAMSPSFSHIFQGGYSAGYYSYKWAEVLDADAFEKFVKEGIFDQATAHCFVQEILSKGGTEHPMELYKKFRGKEPTIEALLRRSGLIHS
ncbi:MAG: M3 family metallopeptidase [Flavobacteriaceae bacterium]